MFINDCGAWCNKEINFKRLCPSRAVEDGKLRMQVNHWSAGHLSHVATHSTCTYLDRFGPQLSSCKVRDPNNYATKRIRHTSQGIICCCLVFGDSKLYTIRWKNQSDPTSLQACCTAMNMESNRTASLANFFFQSL